MSWELRETRVFSNRNTTITYFSFSKSKVVGNCSRLSITEDKVKDNSISTYLNLCLYPDTCLLTLYLIDFFTMLYACTTFYRHSDFKKKQRREKRMERIPKNEVGKSEK